MCNHRYPTGCSSIDIFGPVQENNFSFPFLRKSKNPGGRSKVQEAEVGAGGAVGPESEGPKEATGVWGAGGGCREVGEACLGSGQEPSPGAGTVVGCYFVCRSHVVQGRPGKASFHGTLISLHLFLGELSQREPRPFTLSYIPLSPELALTSTLLYVHSA